MQRQLKDVEVDQVVYEPGDVVVVMDTTYFKRMFGVMVWRCPHRKKNLLWKFLPYETIAKYVEGIDELKSQGWNVKAVVCDGRRGLFKAFNVPIQMCNFHQAMIVNKYVTRRPKLQAGIELQELMRMLPKTDEPSFIHWLDLWHNKWKDFLAEKTIDELTQKWHYTHGRLRSAYQSIKRNLPYLFTYQRYPELNIPNTTNSLEGIFTHIKGKVNLHRGLKLYKKRP